MDDLIAREIGQLQERTAYIVKKLDNIADILGSDHDLVLQCSSTLKNHLADHEKSERKFMWRTGTIIGLISMAISLAVGYIAR